MKRIIWFTRISIFVIYFWFGYLKIIGISPAESLVHELYNITLSHLMSFKAFIVCFGLFECIIGIIWLIPKFSFVAYYAVIVHVIFTVVPVFALTEITWSHTMTPTLIGQYIIKNLLLLSCVMLVKENYKVGLKISNS